jgi:hypothetical protein
VPKQPMTCGVISLRCAETYCGSGPWLLARADATGTLLSRVRKSKWVR